MVVNHKSLTGTNIHVAFAFSYANAAARTGATGFSSTDVGKFALQEDDNTIWMLTAVAPTWIHLSGSNSPLIVTDDGTYYVFSYAGTNLYRVHKTTGQFQIGGDYDAGISI